VAMPTTLTGSIGVIMNLVNSEELLKKIGVSIYTIKSGKYKDMGSISRPLTNEERAIFQNVIDESVFTIKKIPVTIEEQMEYVYRFFGNRRQYKFIELAKNLREKIVIIVTFIAILEMIKNNQLKVYTAGEFNDMILFRTDLEAEVISEGSQN